MKKGKLFLATAFIPVMTGAALYFSSNTASAATPGWYDPMPWDLMWNAERATRMDQLH